MSEQPAPGASGWAFKEIKGASGPPEPPRTYRSISVLTYGTLGAVGLNAVALLLQGMALMGQLHLLSQMAGGDGQDNMAAAAQASDGLVGLTALLSLVTLVMAYVIAAFWIYNAACNVRALGGRDFRVTPGWAVGWYAVPFAALWMPFQGMKEIHLASISPAGWRQLSTPAMLRFWWGAWLLANISGSIVGVIARGSSGIPDLIGATQFELVDVGLDLVASALFVTVVWRTFRAQVQSRAQSGEVAQVFA